MSFATSSRSMSASYKTCHNILNSLFNKQFTRCVNVGVSNLIINVKQICTSSLLPAKVSFKLSDIGEGIREVAVKEWFVKVGDKVSQFDNICEVQSDKASVTITSRYDGVIKKLYYKIDETALVGNPLIDIETFEDEGTASLSSDSSDDEIKPIEISKYEPTGSYKKTLCIPSVRRLAKEHNLDISQISGTGRDGRILKEDVLKYLEAKPEDAETSNIPDIEDRIEPIKGFQKAMVKSMTESLKIPHFVYSDEVIVTNLSKIRKELKNAYDKENIKITFMPFFIKAVSNGLREYPLLNSSVDENCENIIYKKSHNIGIAMATKIGLAVPVIKNVQKLSILEITKELHRLMMSGKEGNFATSDLLGGTFSISNIGVVGGTYTKPVIAPPQVAIVALGTSRILPRFDANQNIVAEEVVCISGSADHRVVDGVTMANFINFFKKQIENPYLLFLNSV